MDSSLRAFCRRTITLVCAVVVSGVFWLQADAQTPMVMKLGTVNPGDSPRNIAAYEFAKVAGEKSKGRIKVEVYINNQLARGEGATLEGVQLGTIDVAPIGSAPIGGMFEPLYLPLDLPFVWSSRQQIWKVMDGPLGQDLLKKPLPRSRLSTQLALIQRYLGSGSRKTHQSHPLRPSDGRWLA